MIYERMARGRQQPGLWILRHAVSRPCSERCDQGATEGILRAGHVARVRGKICHQTPVGLASHALNGPVSALLTALTHPVTRRRYSIESGRTSTAPIEAA